MNRNEKAEQDMAKFILDLIEKGKAIEKTQMSDDIQSSEGVEISEIEEYDFQVITFEVKEE
jgi:hypothetical protein